MPHLLIIFMSQENYEEVKIEIKEKTVIKKTSCLGKHLKTHPKERKKKQKKNKEKKGKNM